MRDSVNKALAASLVRLFPSFSMADDLRWGQVVVKAHQGAQDALSAVGHNGNADQHPVCREILTYLGGAGKTGLEIRKHFTGAGYGWPQDAVDGSLLALLAEGQIEASDKGGKGLSAKEIVQSQIGVLTFRNATTIVTVLHRIGVRKLISDMGLPVKNGEEAQGIPLVLQKLSDLADEVGGAPPLPAYPSKAMIQELLAKNGNEQFVAVYNARSELFGLFQTWTHAKELQAQRSPRWQTLQRLERHANSRPVAARIKPQVEAILSSRSLLSDPDPVQPLIAEVTADLRSALQAARQYLIEVRDTELQTIEDTTEWRKLGDPAWKGILKAYQLGPVDELVIGTEEQLLATLDKTPLRTWEDWVVAVPERLRKAREQAAQLLEPQAVHVRPKSTTLHSAEEVEAYLSDLKAELLQHIQAGNPVIL